MLKRRRSVSTYSNAPYKRPRTVGVSLPANVSQTGLVRAAKAYAPARVPRGPSTSLVGFPKSKTVKMRYADYVALTGTSGIMSEYCFRANSIFDPDQTGAGHQAMGHDQWAQFYEHYTVTKAKMTITVTPIGSGLTSPPIVGILLTNTTAALGNSWQETVELGQGTYKQITLSTAAAVGQKMVCKFDAKSFFNIQDIKDCQERIGATMGANPPTSGDAYFIIWGQAQDAAITIACDVTVVIDYEVLLSDPKQLAQS